MNHTKRAYHRRAAIDALLEGYVESGVPEAVAEKLATGAVDATIHYAAVLGAGACEVLLARIENLRAAFACIVEQIGAGDRDVIERTARTALEVDDKAKQEAEKR